MAHEEAIAHLGRGLTLLEGVAASRERLRLEVSLWVEMVTPALLQGGWQAPTFTRALERLSDLSQHPDLQGDPQRLVALTMLAMMNTWSADPERGRRVGEQLLGLARDDDLQSLLLAHWVLGHCHSWQGQLVAAREHLDQALALLDPEAGRPLGPALGADPGVMGRVMLGFVLWMLGYADQGRASLQQALTRAHAIEEPTTIAFVHVTEGLLHFILGRDAASAQRLGATVQSLGPAALFYGDFVEVLADQDGHGGAAGRRPGPEQDAGRATEAGSALPGVGSGVGQAAYWLVQAQMCIGAGQAEMGLQAMDRALAWIEQTGVRPLEAEVWRMRGELLLADGPDRSARPPRTACGMPVWSRVEEADACFRRALGIARGQEARWMELRAAVSLARLWHSLRLQHRREQACELLSGIFYWFSEGFDLADLVEAKTLLGQLE
jgi:adenylate cyclase